LWAYPYDSEKGSGAGLVSEEQEIESLERRLAASEAARSRLEEALRKTMTGMYSLLLSPQHISDLSQGDGSTG
jgi:hypothetical protein